MTLFVNFDTSSPLYYVIHDLRVSKNLRTSLLSSFSVKEYFRGSGAVSGHVRAYTSTVDNMTPAKRQMTPVQHTICRWRAPIQVQLFATLTESPFAHLARLSWQRMKRKHVENGKTRNDRASIVCSCSVCCKDTRSTLFIHSTRQLGPMTYSQDVHWVQQTRVPRPKKHFTIFICPTPMA